MQTREQVLGHINSIAGKEDCVEVGVQKGDFSLQILNSGVRCLFMVDAWRHFPTDYDDIANVSNQKHASFMAQAMLKVAKFGSRAVMIRDTSENASFLLRPRMTFDWIYLDANHSKEGLLNDLKHWWPLVKEGGVLWGDDYLQGRHFSTDFGVIEALDDFFGQKQYETNLEDHKGIPQWWVIK